MLVFPSLAADEADTIFKEGNSAVSALSSFEGIQFCLVTVT